MNYLIYSLIAVIILSLGLNNILKKQVKYFYFLASLITIIVTTYEFFKIWTGFKLEGISYILERSFMKGYVSTALFILVMFAGALSKKWGITKKLLRVRAEMAILASILILPHFIVYTYKFLINLFNGKTLSGSYIAFVIIGILAFVIMIPLFITSFKKVRVSMSSSKWKSLQRWAYPFYFLIYAHIIIILLNKREINWNTVGTYTVIFLGYFVLKLVNSKKVAK
ncbi:TPA: ferric reductase-like transmembrane domain-containing protein [Clostridium perfringens]